MKWLEDYLSLSKGEKRGFTLLIGIIMFLMGLPYIIPYFVDKNDVRKEFSNFSDAIIRYETQVAAMDTVESGNEKKASREVEYFPFNPNQLEVEGWLKLGLDEKTAHIIDNYREAGGEFRKKSDLKSIYGLDDSTYRQLKEYIRLPEKKEEIADTSVHDSKSRASKDTSNQEKPRKQSANSGFEEPKTKARVNLNQADTNALQEVYGIGSVFSERLVKYRQLLGGFHAKGQLLEVYGLDSAHFENIAPQLRIDEVQIQQLSLNNAEFETLQDHPYLEYSDVLAIVNYRDKVDTIKTKKALLEDAILGKELYKKVAPYLKP